MNSTTLTRRSLGDPISFSLNKLVTSLLTGLNALDKKLRDRPASIDAQAAQLLRLAEAYESTQPSYAADLRAAAMAATAEYDTRLPR